MLGSHWIKSWSSTQKCVTLSSRESELVALDKASTELIGALQLLDDWQQPTTGEVFVDSSAALGVVKRRGCGKMRHIRVGQLWVQEVEEEGTLKYRKVSGDRNPADMLTKHLKEEKILKYSEELGMEARQGRAAKGLHIQV